MNEKQKKWRKATFKLKNVYFFQLIPQYFQHTLGRLLFCIHPVNQFAIFIISNNDMLWGRYKAVLDATVATDLILVCAGMKEAEIQWFVST